MLDHFLASFWSILGLNHPKIFQKAENTKYTIFKIMRLIWHLRIRISSKSSSLNSLDLILYSGKVISSSSELIFRFFLQNFCFFTLPTKVIISIPHSFQSFYPSIIGRFTIFGLDYSENLKKNQEKFKLPTALKICWIEFWSSFTHVSLNCIIQYHPLPLPVNFGLFPEL